MSFKNILSFGLIMAASQTLFAQKSYRWKHLGPFYTSSTQADSGTWVAVGQGWIEDILINENMWYAAAITGGVYRSNNEGKRWVKVDKDTLQLGSLCLLQIDETIYRGTANTHFDDKFGLGIQKSMDQGKSWQWTGLTFKASEKQPIWDIVHLKSHNQLVACSHNSIYVSNDQAETWTLAYHNPISNLRSLLADENSGILWAAGKELLMSDDGGNHWKDVTQRLSVTNFEKETISECRIALCHDPNNASRLLAAYSLRNGICMDESLDGGASWHNITINKDIRRADVHHIEIAIAPGNSNCILIGAVRAYLSKDNGKSFIEVTTPQNKHRQFAHDDIRGVLMKSSKEFFLATDGGVFRTQDTANTWQNVNGKGLTAMQIYGMTTLRDGRTLVGTQDMGYFLYDDKKWLHLGNFYGDGGDALQINERTYLLIGGQLRSTHIDQMKGYQYAQPSGAQGTFDARLAQHPTKDSCFYLLDHDCWYFNGIQWKNLTRELQGGPFKMLAFDVNKNKYDQLWVAYDQPTWNAENLKNKLFKSIDGGMNWTDYTANCGILAWRNITDILSLESNPDEIYISLGMHDEGDTHKVYRSKDGGQTWINYSEGLPPFETFILRQIPGTKGIVVATLGGLYYRNEKLNKWQHLAGKIPAIAIRDFEIDTNNKKIIACTYGNGLWEMKLPRKMLKAN